MAYRLRKTYLYLRTVLMLIAVVSVAFSTHMEVYAAPDDPNAPAEEDGANSSGETSGRKFSPQDSGFSNNQYERGNGSEFYTVVCDATTGGYSVQLEGADNIEKVLNYFMAKGLTLAQAAGFVGNMMQESGVDPRKIQGGAIADDSYQMQNGVGFGLIQWTFTGRQAPLKKKADDMKKKIYDIEAQLEYIWDELNGGYKHTLSAVKAADNPVDAAIAAHGPPNPGYEASADSPDKVRTVRGGNAQKVYDKYKDAPPAGSMSSSGSSGATTTEGSSAPSTSAGSTDKKATVALDPGHSVPDINDTESTTGAILSDYANGAEVNDMWDVTNKVKTGLEKEGYVVNMLRNSKEEKVNFQERADRAKGSAMAVSLHSTSGAGAKSEVFYQFVGGKRVGPKATKTFDNEDTATKSKQYSDAMATARAEKEGHAVTTGKVNFDSRGGNIASGDITWVQLLSPETPWVYNEYAGNGTGGAVPLTEEEKNKYAEGVIAGVIAANPQGGERPAEEGDGCGTSSSDSAGGGDLSAVTKRYAWEKSNPKAGSINPKKEYADAVAKSKSAGLYVGGISHPGIDCGGFVTLLLRDSGFEKGYNFDGKGGPTSKQEEWMQKNWKKIGSGPQDPAKLKAGDVAINANHTFVFVGDVGGNFGSNIASASLDERAPQAGGDDAGESGFNWYRKK
jgi:N-acetylmuramoyl-L-alanine amidase